MATLHAYLPHLVHPIPARRTCTSQPQTHPPSALAMIDDPTASASFTKRLDSIATSLLTRPTIDVRFVTATRILRCIGFDRWYPWGEGEGLGDDPDARSSNPLEHLFLQDVPVQAYRASFVDRIIRACPRITDLFISPPLAVNLEGLGALHRLSRLAVAAKSLFSPNSMDFTHPLFRNVTHLELIDEPHRPDVSLYTGLIPTTRKPSVAPILHS
ncbi:hypothetical protein B0H13DRAFT_2676067 [Mycena leptocephala]|nr:hypothetical protein B0H13DRAFT_2676067 [Mycena leptocephala]